jgi:hypothetical protein
MPGPLSISARPRGGEWLAEELSAWRRAGIDIVVSLLEPEETSDLDLEQEKVNSEANGIEFHSFPIIDRGVPTDRMTVQSFLGDLDARLSQEKVCSFTAARGLDALA